MLVTGVVEVVVVRVLEHAFVEVCPREHILDLGQKTMNTTMKRTYHCILLVLNCLDGNFCEEVIVQHVGSQMRLDRETFRKELLVEVLTRLLAHENTATVLVLAWSRRLAHHLQNIHDRVVNVTMLLAFVKLDTHNDYHVAGNR